MKTNQLFSKARWLLTSCLLLLIFSTNAWATVVSFSATNLNAPDGGRTIGSISLSTSNMTYSNSNGLTAGSASKAFTLTASGGATISQVLITSTTGSRYSAGNITNCTSCTRDGNVYTCTISPAASSVTCTNSGGGLKITRIDVTYSGGSAPKRIYMKCGSSWCDATPRFFAHSWGSADNDLELYAVGGCDPAVYYADIPSDNTSVVFTRQNSSSTGILWSGSNFWNQSEDITINTNNLFTCTGWNNSKGTFSGSVAALSVTYNANGATGSVPTDANSYGYGATVTVLGKNTLAKADNMFIGWNTEDDGTGTWYAPGETFAMECDDVTLYAQWATELDLKYVWQVTGKFCDDQSGDNVASINMIPTNDYFTLTGTGVTQSSGSSLNIGKTAGNNFLITAKSGYQIKSICFYGKIEDASVYKTTDGSDWSGTIGSTSTSADNHYTFDNINATHFGVKLSGTKGIWIRNMVITIVPVDECSATAPGAISKGTLSACSLPLTASGSPASNNTWYWQASSTGTSTSESGATKNVNSTGTYYIRSYCSDGSGCWSDARSYTVSASDLTPAAPSALTAASTTAKGTTFTVEDAKNTNNYEFYVSTASTAPVAGTAATHSATSKTLTITNLYAGTTFYAWVRAKCGSNKSAWTALTGNTFTTSTVTMTPTLTNVTHSSGATSGIGGSDYTAVFAANTGYALPSTITVTIGGAAKTAGTDYTWTQATGTLTIPASNINGNIAVTVSSPKAAPSSVDVSGNYHVYPGETITLTAAVTGGNGPKTYQWYHGGTADGNAIDGATSATYTKASCVVGDAGSYYCKVTCGGTETTTSGAFNVKIMQFYLKNSGGSDISNHALVKGVDANHASLSLSLTGGTTYKFRVTDGCGDWYGNDGEMTSSNCTDWHMDKNNDCRVTTSTKSATYTFTFDFTDGLLGSEMKVSVVYPSGDQAADKVIYWDNSILNWAAGNQWYRIGKGNHNTKTQMTLVPGTANLYTVTTAEYNGFEYWHIANNDGNGTGNIFWTKGEEEHAITEAMGFEGSPVTADAITVTPTAGSHGTGTSSDNDNCEFYEYGQQNGMKTDRVTIDDYSGGTITVNYTNTSGYAATLTSGYADLAHTVILTSITAVADEGYDASAITINGGAYSANYVVTGNTTIAASFTLKTYTISYNKGTYGTGSKASETKTHGVNFTLPGSTFTYGGHAQDGWSTSDGGALAYALSGSYTTNAAQEFFPHWKCNTPTITDNGDNTVSITVPSGTTVRYTTDGTNPSSSTGTVYSTTFSIAADCTVKAIAYQSNCTDSEIASQACDYTAPANFQMIADASAGSEQTLSSGESITQGSKNCATLTGGTAVYTGPGMKVQKGSPYGWYFGSNSDVITITLTGHILQVGSIIAIDGNCGSSNNGIKINTNGIVKTGESSGGEFSGTYTVKAGDTDLIGTNVLTLTRSTGSATRMYSITLSNCQAASPCTTPTLPSLSNQTGCSYSAWNATPSNASTISAAGESISYSWKKGATEKATTASYTPDADGTDYTVTVTVSKAGKISTSVTSSALTATKYAATSISTQPTTAVAAIIDEDFTLGSTLAATGQGTLNYQWFSYSNPAGDADETSVRAASTTKTYTTSKASAGTYYYRVKVIGDCGTVASNVITVTVSEPPCFSATNLVKNSDWSDVAVDGFIDAAKVVGTITGGTIKNTGSAALGSNSKSENAGLVMDGSSKQVTVTLSGSNHLTVGSVITLTAAVSDGAKSGTSRTSGLVVSGYDCSPVNKASETAYDSFTQSYTVTEESSLVEANSFTIALKSGLDKTYLHAITVTGCEDCTPIPVKYISYSSTNIFAYGGTPSVAYVVNMSNPGGGTVTYSSSNTDVATVDSETGLVTAVGPGTTVITAAVPEAGGYCAANITKTITVQALVTQTINVGAGSGSGVAWGTAPNMTFDESTIALASMRRVANISNSGYTFDENELSKADRGGRYMTAQFTGTESSKNASKYLTMKFKNENYRMRLTNVVVPIQPVSNNGKAVVEIYKNGSKVAESSEVTGITKSVITDVTFTLITPYIVDVNTEIEVRIFFYGQTTGFRLASAILVNGSILRAKQFTGEGNWDDASNWEYHDKPETYHDVDVWNGATLTITGNKTAHDLKVKSGGTLNVSTNSGTGITLTLNRLNLEGGLSTSLTYDMPRVYIDPKSSIDREEDSIYFDVAVDARHYYPIAMPFDVKIDEVDYANTRLKNASTYGTHYVVKYYDGERRATVGADRENNWKVVEQGESNVLKAGKGYILTAVKVAKYTTDGGTIRFPMKVDDAWLTKGEQATVDAVTKNKVTVTAWNGVDENSAARKNKTHKGWNLMGVPYMSCYQTGNGSTTDMPTDEAAILPGKMKVTGEWDEEDEIMYVSIPTSDFSEYIQKNIVETTTKLLPGWCFFVQLDNSGTLTFATTHETNSTGIDYRAPKAQYTPIVKTGITLSGADASDNTSFLISDRFSTDYEIGKDLEKLFGETGYTLATYSLVGGTKYAYNALSETDIQQVIPIGYRAPADGDYTFSINPIYAESNAFESVNLIDYETGIVTDLLLYSYTFSTERTQSDTRFALNIVKRQDATTDIETVSGDGLEAGAPRKLIINNELYIIVDGKMYDATGKAVK